jgi:5-(carboxyamino)imidazole ribonucleotide mutase
VGTPRVGIIMGSDSDLPVMRPAAEALAEFGIEHELRIVSAHRTPAVLYDYASTAADRGLEVIIAGAGGAAHLPGMAASMTSLPVIGVPVAIQPLDGLDSLLSIADLALRARMDDFREQLRVTVEAKDTALTNTALEDTALDPSND